MTFPFGERWSSLHLDNPCACSRRHSSAIMPGMKPPALLANVSIVLVDTKTPGNIGAVARSMMNLGLSRLILVRPPRDPRRDALRLAAGAEEIIKNALRVSSLQDAVAEQDLVVGTSRHRGRLRRNVRPPRNAAERLAALLGGNRVAILFGNEVNGLDRRDLALCQEIITIPSSDAFPSLNLSHAVAIVAYELFLASLGSNVPTSAPSLAPAQELERFYSHLQQVLEEIGFLDRRHPDRIMFSLRQLFGRALPDARDIRILRGILTRIMQCSTTKAL